MICIVCPTGERAMILYITVLPAKIRAAVLAPPIIERRKAACSLLTPLSTAQSGSSVSTVEWAVNIVFIQSQLSYILYIYHC